jgi:hypothetical protein
VPVFIILCFSVEIFSYETVGRVGGGEGAWAPFTVNTLRKTQTVYTRSPKSEWSIMIQASDQLAAKKLYFATGMQDTGEFVEY